MLNSSDIHPVRTFFLILGSVAVVVAIVFGIWIVSVGTSNFFGAGNATKQINSVNNRLAAYNHFYTLDQTIRTQAENAATAKDTFEQFNKTNPLSSNESFAVTQTRNNLQTDYTGLVSICVQNVNEYNADASAYTSTRFKDNALPWNYNTNVCMDPTKLPAPPAAPTN